MSSGSATNVVGQCGVDGCLLTPSFFCSSCHLVKYCSKGHQIADWKNHRKVCSPLTLQSSTDLGRHYVASRNLKAGTLLLAEYPVLVQPITYCCQQEDLDEESQIQEEGQDDDENDEGEEVVLSSNYPGLRLAPGHGQIEGQGSVCIACCMPADEKKCSKCDWPICSIECSKAKIHADNECPIFVKNSFKVDQIDQDILDGVFFIRGLLLKKSQPEVWDKIQDFQSTSSNKTAVLKEREIFPSMVSRFQEKFKKLEQDLLGEDFVNTDELVKLYGIHSRNALGQSVDREEKPEKITVGSGVGILYLKSSMFSHGCFPNCSWGVTCGPVFKIEIRTAVDIVKGQILSINYNPSDLMMGSMKLNLSGMKVAKFNCFCARCVDPTELNSMMSAVKCTKGDCTDGYLIPKDPKNFSSFSIWACTICGDKSTETWEVIHHLTNRAENMTRKFTDFEPKKIEEMLNLLRKHLHPNHWVIQGFCQQAMILISIAKASTKVQDHVEDYYVEITRYLEQVSQLTMPGLSYQKSQIQQLLFYALQEKCRRSRHNKPQLFELAQECSTILDQLLKVKKLDPSSRNGDGQWKQDVMKLMETRTRLDFILLNINLI